MNLNPPITSAADAFAITPSDTAPNVTRGVYVGGAGNVTVVTLAGSTVTFTAVPVGTVVPIQTKLVKATLTTATLLVGLI
jgi:hypothetical protein